MARYPAGLEEHWAADGDALMIRPIRPDDAAEHNAFFHRLSSEDLRLRFFATVRELSPALLKKFTQLDYERDMAFIAVRETTGQIVGVAQLARVDNPCTGEFAVVVEHDLHGKGIATHLMQRLLDWAVRHGLCEVTGQILAENTAMLDLARHLGFHLQQLRGDARIMEARLSLAPPAQTNRSPRPQ